MAVIPSVAVLGRVESVRVLFIVGDGTLCDAVDAIHFVGSQLADSVPVNRGSVVVVAVLYVDDDFITPACLNGRTRVGAIEGDTANLFLAIGRQIGGWVDGEPVLRSS